MNFTSWQSLKEHDWKSLILTLTLIWSLYWQWEMKNQIDGSEKNVKVIQFFLFENQLFG